MMLDRSNAALSQIHAQIMWSRLIAVVEEQAQTLVRTAFSTSVREAGDLSAGVFDAEGRMLAQAVTGTPGHVNSMANAVKHFLKAYPLDKMAPGDHYITNDPWLTCGHLHRGEPDLPRRQAGRPVRRDCPCRRYRRGPPGAPREAGLLGGGRPAPPAPRPQRAEEGRADRRDP